MIHTYAQDEICIMYEKHMHNNDNDMIRMIIARNKQEKVSETFINIHYTLVI